MLQLVNDSVAYFDAHKDSVSAIAQHPTQPSLIATGGSEGDGDDAPGRGYVFDTSPIAGRPEKGPGPARRRFSRAAASAGKRAVSGLGRTASLHIPRNGNPIRASPPGQ